MYICFLCVTEKERERRTRNGFSRTYAKFMAIELWKSLVILFLFIPKTNEEVM